MPAPMPYRPLPMPRPNSLTAVPAARALSPSTLVGCGMPWSSLPSAARSACCASFQAAGSSRPSLPSACARAFATACARSASPVVRATCARWSRVRSARTRAGSRACDAALGPGFGRGFGFGVGGGGRRGARAPRRPASAPSSPASGGASIPTRLSLRLRGGGSGPTGPSAAGAAFAGGGGAVPQAGITRWATSPCPATLTCASMTVRRPSQVSDCANLPSIRIAMPRTSSAGRPCASSTSTPGDSTSPGASGGIRISTW